MKQEVRNEEAVEVFRPNARQLGPSVATWAHQISGIASAAIATQGVEYIPLAAALVMRIVSALVLLLICVCMCCFGVGLVALAAR